ncbi:MATE family efflux transporter [Pseudaeromonas sharmana]|uniref:Multidrug-efflux transporter n=1 Tax=Pseudaeromonas sharmana TaxID=328412 RepID=A0ABV8CQ33_9GAMM
MFAFFSECRRLVRLASPILIAQVAQTAMTLVDTIMAGQVSATDLAAVSVAASFWLPIVLFVQGIIMALTPIVAQLNGAQKAHDIPAAVSQGFWLSLIAIPPTMLLLYLTPLLLASMQVEPALAAKTAGFLHAMMWGVPAFVGYQVLRNYTEGLSHTIPTMFIGFVGLMVNIPANYVFIHGKFGMPALGGVGCGVASALVFWAMFLSMLWYVRHADFYHRTRLFCHWYRPDWVQIGRIFRLGFPIALALFCEVTLFTLVALLLAPLGSQIVASHQVALNFSSLIFMLPLSLGFAVTIRVGHAIGEQDPAQAKLAALSGLGLGLFLALFTAFFTIIGRHWIAHQYSQDPVVITLAAQLMIFAAVYQLSDTVQVVSSSALRGYKDTKAIFLITMLAYWGLGLPTGIILGLTDWICPKMGPFGFWIGFIVGLSSAALMLGTRLRVIFGRFQHK